MKSFMISSFYFCVYMVAIPFVYETFATAVQSHTTIYYTDSLCGCCNTKWDYAFTNNLYSLPPLNHHRSPGIPQQPQVQVRQSKVKGQGRRQTEVVNRSTGAEAGEQREGSAALLPRLRQFYPWSYVLKDCAHLCDRNFRNERVCLCAGYSGSLPFLLCIMEN